MFAGIGAEIVAFDDRQIDELVAIDQHPGQRRPSAIEHAGHRFEICRSRGRLRGAGGARQQRASWKIRGHRLTDRIEDRRKDVDVARGDGRHFASPCARPVFPAFPR